MTTRRNQARVTVDLAILDAVEKMAVLSGVSTQQYIQDALRLKLTIDARYRDAQLSAKRLPNHEKSLSGKETWQRFLALADYIEMAGQQIERAPEG